MYMHPHIPASHSVAVIKYSRSASDLKLPKRFNSRARGLLLKDEVICIYLWFWGNVNDPALLSRAGESLGIIFGANPVYPWMAHEGKRSFKPRMDRAERLPYTYGIHPALIEKSYCVPGTRSWLLLYHNTTRRKREFVRRMQYLPRWVLQTSSGGISSGLLAPVA